MLDVSRNVGGPPAFTTVEVGVRRIGDGEVGDRSAGSEVDPGFLDLNSSSGGKESKGGGDAEERSEARHLGGASVVYLAIFRTGTLLKNQDNRVALWLSFDKRKTTGSLEFQTSAEQPGASSSEDRGDHGHFIYSATKVSDKV